MFRYLSTADCFTADTELEVRVSWAALKRLPLQVHNIDERVESAQRSLKCPHQVSQLHYLSLLIKNICM